MKFTGNKVVLLLLGMLFVSGNVVAQGPDRVILKNDSATGEIVGYTATHYLFKTNGEEQRVPRKKVENIQYGDTTKKLASMVKAFIKDRYSEVVSYEKSVREEIKDGQLREIHKPRVTYFLAASHFHQGAFDQALEEVKKALENYPNQVWFERMARMRVLAFTFSKYNPNANVSDEVYNEVSKLGESVIALSQNRTDAPKPMVEELKVLRLEALEELGEGKLEVTKVKYDNLEVSSPDLKRRVFAGAQRCVIRQANLEKLKAVREAYKKKTKKNGSLLLKAGFQNTNGAFAWSQWKNGGDKNRLRDALLSFVRAQLLYHEPSDVSYPIQHRQSLLNTIRVYDAISENTSKGPSFYEDQAQKTLDELKSRYPGSPEARKGKRLLEQ